MSKYLADTLKKARKAKGYTLREVDKLTGVSNAFISQLENDKGGEPSPHILRKLAKCYDITYTGLMMDAGYLP
jgi:transcriptional regulator with XRE-family HTH domain